MNKKEFLEKFSDYVLQVDFSIDENTDLLELDAWDSLAQITTVAFFDKEIGQKITIGDVRDFNTMADILSKGNIK